MIPGPGSYGKIQDWAPGYGYEMSIPAAAFEEEPYEAKRTITSTAMIRGPQPTISRYSVERNIRKVDEHKYLAEQENERKIISENIIEETKEQAPTFDVAEDVVVKTYSPAKIESKVATGELGETVTKTVIASSSAVESGSPSKVISQKFTTSKTSTEVKTTAFTKTCKL